MRKISNFISNILDINENDPIQLDETIVTKDLFNKIYQYCEKHEFNPPQVHQPIKSSNL